MGLREVDEALSQGLNPHYKPNPNSDLNRDE